MQPYIDKPTVCEISHDSRASMWLTNAHAHREPLYFDWWNMVRISKGTELVWEISEPGSRGVTRSYSTASDQPKIPKSSLV